MGHGASGGHQSHSKLHAAKARGQQERQKAAKKERGGMSLSAVRKLSRGKKKT